jgi:hypothetical protein
MPFYERGDVRIHYEEVGSGFPLMLIPGLRCRSSANVPYLSGLETHGSLLISSSRSLLGIPCPIYKRSRCVLSPFSGTLNKTIATARR